MTFINDINEEISFEARTITQASRCKNSFAKINSTLHIQTLPSQNPQNYSRCKDVNLL